MLFRSMGASLATGSMDDTGVICPWHAWRFCVKTGTWLDNPNPKLNIDRFDVRVEGDQIQLCVGNDALGATESGDCESDETDAS